MLVDECQKIISQNNSGVKKIIVDGNIYWLKIYGENKSNAIRKVSSFMSKINLFSLFQTQSVCDSFERFEHEKSMLHYLKQQNFCVPDIDLEGPGYFVTHDQGTPLNQVDSSRITDTVLNEIFLAFAKLHKQNIAHGRPALRDIVLSEDDKPTLIDFEESIMDASPIIKARDIYILLMDLCRIKSIHKNKKLSALLLWKSHMTDMEWNSLLKINMLVKRIKLLPRCVLIFKKDNKLSQQLLETIELFDNFSEDEI